jgi:hypothetical protein
MTMLQRIWQDGVKELADKVERDMFIGWVDQPRVMALEAKRAPNDWLAARLAENPKSDLYADPDLKVASTVDFFSASHLNNVLDANFGTYDNTATGDTDDPFNATSERASRNHFNGLLGPNGKPLGLSKTHVIVPTTREEQAREFYEQDLLIQAVQNAAGTENVAAVTQKNRYKGTVQIVVARELADQNAYYELALNKPGMHPWVVLTDGPPEEILQDKSSGLYAEHLQIALSYILRGNVELAMPNCVRRVTLS